MSVCMCECVYGECRCMYVSVCVYECVYMHIDDSFQPVDVGVKGETGTHTY